MTIHEFLRYIPLGSEVAIHLNTADKRNADHRGTVVEYRFHPAAYSGGSGYQINLLLPDGNTYPVYPKDIDYVELISPPQDYGTDVSGRTVSDAADKLFSVVNDFRNKDKINQMPFSLKGAFQEPLRKMIGALNRRNLEPAAEQIGRLSTNGSVQGNHDLYWDSLFETLLQARVDAVANGDPDAVLLRRSEALMYCFAYKKCKGVTHRPLHDAVELIRENLVEQRSSVLPVTAFADGISKQDQALDWFLLAVAYHHCKVQDSCTYVAMVQSMLHQGSLFTNEYNRRMFCYLCGSAHDFTMIREILESYHMTGGGSHEQLRDLGKLMCWMLYQLGGQGCLDASELLPLVTCKNALDNAQLRDLQERMLSFSYKYAPRNRKDRFMALSDAMKLMLERLQTQPLDQEDEKYFGYIYEFHGPRGVLLSEVNGHILGDSLLPYRFTLSMDVYEDIGLIVDLQNIYDEAEADVNHTLTAVRFREALAGIRPNRQGAYDLSIIPGGMVRL